jgi:hypothetical protein
VTDLWRGLVQQPVFVLTADQDWAPEWATGRLLAFARDLRIPLHVFVTNPSKEIDGAIAAGVASRGIHPNFLPGSTHGASPEEVIDHFGAFAPEATTVRAHSLREDTPVLRLLAASGFTADSNLCLHLQPGIEPLLGAAGMLRLPIFLEDDVLLHWGAGDLPAAALEEVLLTPGLKILNVHPALFALNAPSLVHYERHRPDLYGGHRGPVPAYPGRGVQTLLADVASAVRSNGGRFTALPDLVDMALVRLAENAPAALRTWGVLADRG